MTAERRSWLVAALLGVVLVALVTASAVLWTQRRADRLDPAAVAEAQAAATDFFSLDHRHIEADLRRMLAAATGEFAKTYRQESAKLRESVVRKRLVMTATVPEGGTALEYLTKDRAQVLVAVDVRTAADGAAVSDTRYRTRVRLTDVDGRWRVSGLEQVG